LEGFFFTYNSSLHLMYQDLADAVESMKEKGFTHTYTISENVITCEELETEFDVDNLKIVDSIESNEGVKGTLVIGFGMYSDPNKAKLIDRLLKNT